MIERLSADASLNQIVDTLQHMEPTPTAKPPSRPAEDLPAGGLWDLLEQAAATVEMPADWARDRDHYLYGTPKRSTPA